jgi:exosortase
MAMGARHRIASDGMSNVAATRLDLSRAAEHAIADRWIVGAVVAIAVALCVPAFAGLSYLWKGSQFYGHAYAIPLVAGYLAYEKRRALGAAMRDLRPPSSGPLVAFGAALLLVLALIGDVGFVAGVGIPLLLGATAFAIGGVALARPLLLPLVFLALMVPPPRFLTYEILFRLKLFVTETAVALLHAAGVTVAAEGNQIFVPGHALFVADACSGLTSIVTLLPLACIVAYFLTHGVWRRVVVVASVVPLALAANIFRVIVTVQLAGSWGIEFAQGILHETFSLGTYVVGTLAVIAVARILR